MAIGYPEREGGEREEEERGSYLRVMTLWVWAEHPVDLVEPGLLYKQIRH